jgi:hypothetical protein
MLNCGVTIHVACQLHNIWIDDFCSHQARLVCSGCIPGFWTRNRSSGWLYSPRSSFKEWWTTNHWYWSDLEWWFYKDMWTQTIRDAGLTCQTYSKLSKKVIWKYIMLTWNKILVSKQCVVTMLSSLFCNTTIMNSCPLNNLACSFILDCNICFAS